MSHHQHQSVISKDSDLLLIQQLKNKVTTVPNFPKPGIDFRDISPLLANAELREQGFDLLAQHYKDQGIEAVCGMDARGFIIATALAQRLKCAMVMIRKPSKMPNTISVNYNLEYGSNQLEIQKDVVQGMNKVLVVDDLLATGGTVLAACDLIQKAGGKVCGVCCMIELDGLGGRQNIQRIMNIDTYCPLVFPASEQGSMVHVTPAVPPVKQTPYRPLKPLPNTDDHRVIIFSHPSMDSIAENMCNHYSQQFRRGVIHWDKFPDGYYNIQFEHMNELEGRHVVFLGSLFDPSKLLEQLSMIMVLPRQFVQSLNIVIPYFGPATMERVEEEGTLATAETTARILTSCMPMTRSGPATLRIFDIHALPVRFYFTDNVMMKMMSAVSLITRHLKANHKMTIAFPDEGAGKRFKKSFEGFPTIICAKVRDGDKRTIKITDRVNWPLNDSDCMDHVLIVDDLVQSGGTLDECRRALLQLGAKKVSAFVVHSVFPNEGYKRFMKGGDREGFEYFFITNTIPEVANKLKGISPFHVFELEDMLSDSILQQLKLPRAKTPALMRTVYVASGKDSKLEATRRAFSIAQTGSNQNVNLKVISIPVKSGVNEQPLSVEETEEGALNRLNALMNQVSTTGDKATLTGPEVYYVAMENGIFEEGGQWVDKCCLKVVSASDPTNVKTVWSAPVTIPQEHTDVVNQAVQVHQGRVTAGSLLELKLGLKEDTWHEAVCGVDRISLMQTAIESVITL